MEKLQFETTVVYDDSQQKMWITIPNTYWTRFFLYKSADRMNRLRDLYAKFKFDDEAYTGYLKGKLYETGISELPPGAFKCENPEFQEALREQPDRLLEIIQELVIGLIKEFNDDMESVIEKNRPSNN